MEGCGHKPRDSGSPQKLEEAGRILPWSLLRKQDTNLELRLLFSRTAREKFLLLEAIQCDAVIQGGVGKNDPILPCTRLRTGASLVDKT